MQARTERNLGFVAALLLTAAAFAAPGLSTQIAHNDMAYEEQIQLALTGTCLSSFAILSISMRLCRSSHIATDSELDAEPQRFLG